MLGLLGVAAVFLAAQGRSRNPLMPLSLFRGCNHTGAYATMLLAVGPMGTFYVIALYLLEVLRVSPLQADAAWLPFAAGFVLSLGFGFGVISPTQVAGYRVDGREGRHRLGPAQLRSADRCRARPGRARRYRRNRVSVGPAYAEAPNGVALVAGDNTAPAVVAGLLVIAGVRAQD
ncbi:hypothetical protein ACH347_34210 [Saccharopolyspora sp. 5N102]|uniref:hypothetical protein n=1 Tax=Saccharopolyspora sp. 5N102 TaxID=3375155 RepID=UPI0037BC7905